MIQGGVPSTLAPAGVGAHIVAPLAWLLIAAASIAFVVVTIFVLVGAFARRGSLAAHAPADTGGGTIWIQLGGILIPLIVLGAAFVLSERALARFPERASGSLPPAPLPGGVAGPGDSALTIDVTGHQWWWQFRYHSDDLTQDFATANEIHLPVGRPVRFLLHSVDVNHSFWIPQLSPKEDLVPGSTNHIVVTAERAGTFRGECSEYCGDEHARMAFTVVAESPERFAAWLAQQRQDAVVPTDSLAARGRAAFVDNACAFCHTVRGTTARGIVAPDLTHLASRSTLAAGTFPNTRPTLEGWIMNAPAMKPGTQMPAFPKLDSATLRAIVAYLVSLR